MVLLLRWVSLCTFVARNLPHCVVTTHDCTYDDLAIPETCAGQCYELCLHKTHQSLVFISNLLSYTHNYKEYCFLISKSCVMLMSLLDWDHNLEYNNRKKVLLAKDKSQLNFRLSLPGLDFYFLQILYLHNVICNFPQVICLKQYCEICS